MITINKYDTISRKVFTKECINKDGGAEFCVSGIEVEDLLGDMENLNGLLLDNTVEDGYLLGDISFRFTGRASMDGTTTIKVTVADATEYLLDGKNVDI